MRLSDAFQHTCHKRTYCTGISTTVRTRQEFEVGPPTAVQQDTVEPLDSGSDEPPADLHRHDANLRQPISGEERLTTTASFPNSEGGM